MAPGTGCDPATNNYSRHYHAIKSKIYIIWEES